MHDDSIAQQTIQVCKYSCVVGSGEVLGGSVCVCWKLWCTAKCAEARTSFIADTRTSERKSQSSESAQKT